MLDSDLKHSHQLQSTVTQSLVFVIVNWIKYHFQTLISDSMLFLVFRKQKMLIFYKAATNACGNILLGQVRKMWWWECCEQKSADGEEEAFPTIPQWQPGGKKALFWFLLLIVLKLPWHCQQAFQVGISRLWTPQPCHEQVLCKGCFHNHLNQK